MSSSMQSIKRRMRSVESTKKITRAMELVATSKLSKTRSLLETQKPYYTMVYDVVEKILSRSSDMDNPYLQQKSNSTSAVILITGSLGLCGGYNNNVIKCAKANIQADDRVFVLGGKGAIHYPNANSHYRNLVSDLSFTSVRQLVQEVLNLYRQNAVGSIKIIYTQFVNNLTFEPHCLTLLPFNQEGRTTEEKTDLSFEPNPQEVLDKLIPMYLQATIYGYLVESITSENASRRMSMENATDNATELTEQLRLKYNQARQSAITNEISEIVAGAQVQ